MYVRTNKSGKSTPNDLVMTNPALAKFIVRYFRPTGKILEPCKGSGSFTRFMPGCDWAEITLGRDFLNMKTKNYDWIITNPPFSIYDLFLEKSLSMADNVVFLTTLNKTFKSKKIDEMIQKYGGLKEVLAIGSGGSVGFPFGFPCGCLHYKKNYSGNIKYTRFYDWRK